MGLTLEDRAALESYERYYLDPDYDLYLHKWIQDDREKDSPETEEGW